ncbi:MAG: hypothetical protein AAF431_13980, partial [Pseudomonadota bacterium]
MSIDPWQDINSDSVLFIVDADHQVEEQLLLDWIKTTQQSAGFQGAVNHVIVPIAHDPEDISIDDLQPALNLADETLVVPIRLGFPNNRSRKRGLSLVLSRAVFHTTRMGTTRVSSARFKAGCKSSMEMSSGSCAIGT